MYYGFGGILGLLFLILEIYAIIRVLQGKMDPGMKIVWILVILLLPGLGAILYFVVGPG